MGAGILLVVALLVVVAVAVAVVVAVAAVVAVVVFCDVGFLLVIRDVVAGMNRYSCHLVINAVVILRCWLLVFAVVGFEFD